MRRVVTGMTPEGKSVFVSDDEVQPITLSMVPGSENYQIWGADEAVQLPTDGSAPTAQGYLFIYRLGLSLARNRHCLFTTHPDRVH